VIFSWGAFIAAFGVRNCSQNPQMAKARHLRSISKKSLIKDKFIVPDV